MRRIALLALASSFTACSSQTTAAQVSPVSDALLGASASSVDSPTRPATDGTAAVKPAGKVPSGYRRVTRRGTDYYCRSVVTLGTRFAEQMRFTREQVDEIARRTDSAMDDMERGRKVCVGGDQCGEY